MMGNYHVHVLKEGIGSNAVTYPVQKGRNHMAIIETSNTNWIPKRKTGTSWRDN